nr:MAG TPA: hypothetical protein [Caudoviricetes sp.]
MLPVVDCYYILCYKTSFHTCKRATFSSVALFIPSVALPLPAVHPQSNVRSSCDNREIACGFAGGNWRGSDNRGNAERGLWKR